MYLSGYTPAMPSDTKLSRSETIEPDAIWHVRLGDHIYGVAPQKIGYLRSKLGVVFQQLLAGAGEGENLADLAINRSYELLSVFIPDLMPRHEFEGYPTEEAMKNGDYDERYDKSPTAEQIMDAVTTVMEANKIDLLKHVGKIIDPLAIRDVVTETMTDSMRRASQSSSSQATALTP